MHVTILRAANLLQLSPVVEELKAVLAYDKRVQLGGNARDVSIQHIRLYRQEGDKLYTPAGLLRRACTALTNAKHTYTFTDGRKNPLPEPELDCLSDLRSGQEEAMAHIIAGEGIVEAPTGFGKSYLLKKIPQLWPTARVVVCTYSTDIASQLFADLKEAFPAEQLGRVGGGYCDPEKRIVVCVDKSLLKCRLDKIDIFVYDEVHRAAAEQTKGHISKIRGAKKMLGFSASPTGRGDNSDLETEALFGPLLCSFTYQQVQQTGALVPIEVYLFSCVNVPPASYVLSTALERNCIWRSNARNLEIQKAVRWAQEHCGADCQIMISVKTVEHAVHLGKLLPDFTLVYAGMDGAKRQRWEQDGLLPAGVHPITLEQREQYRKQFAQGTLRRAIATSVWGTGVNFPQLNVLIRADAGSSSIANTQIPGRVTRPSDGKSVGLVLDFMDEFNDTLKRRSAKRVAAYRKKGWKITCLTRPTAYLQK